MTVDLHEAPLRVGAGEVLAWLVLPPASLALTFHLALGHRPDWLGHFLAGFGASLLLILAALRITGGRPGTALAATLLATGLGWLAERSVFALAGPDPMDFHAQTLGAGAAGLALLMGRAERTPPLPCLLLALVTVVLGGVFAFLA